MKIGDSIKLHRENLKMTQKELAQDICTQSQISKIEKNEIIPLSTLLIKISNKLEVSLDELVNKDKMYANQQVSMDINKVNEYLRYREYQNLYFYLNKLNKNDLSDSELLDYQYYLLIAQERVEGKEIIRDLEKILTDKKHYLSPSLEINILNSLGILLMDRGNFTSSRRYFLRAYNNIFKYNMKGHIIFKVMYNYLRLLLEDENYSNMYDTALECIHLSYKNNNIISLSEFIYFKIYALYKLDMKKMIDLEELQVAIFLSKKQKKLEVMETLIELKEKIKKTATT